MSGSLGGCGQACLYGRANDVLTLQTEYMSQLSMRLIGARQSLDPESLATEEHRRASLDVLKRNLKVYCRAQNISFDKIPADKGWNRDGDRCLGSYLRAMARAMETNGSVLLKNYRTMLELTGPAALRDPKGLQMPRNTEKLLKNPSLLRSKNLTLYPDFPFHPALEAIDPVVKRLGQIAQRKIDERASSYSGKTDQQRADADEALVKWWNSIPKCPSRDEYAKVEFVERYPSQPTGEKLPRVVTDPKTGTIVPDVPAFEAARARCEEEKKQAFREIPLEIPSEVLGDVVTEEKRDAFNRARDSMVRAIDKKFKEKKGREFTEYTVRLFVDRSSKGPGTSPEEERDLSEIIVEIRKYADFYFHGNAGR